MPPALRQLYLSTCLVPKTYIKPRQLDMLCHSQYDLPRYINIIVKRATPIAFFEKHFADTTSDNLDVLVMVVSGMIDVSTKLVFSDIAMAIVEGIAQLGYTARYYYCKNFLECNYKKYVRYENGTEKAFTKVIIVGAFSVTSYIYANNQIPVVLQDTHRLPIGEYIFSRRPPQSFL